LGAASYSWSVGGTGTTKTVTPALTTVYTVTGTTGICSATGSVNVTVNPNPTVTVNNATICASGTATLVATGATTYSWNTSAITSSIAVSPPVNTTYTVTGTSLGCSNTKTVSVTIGSAISINVVASPSLLCGSGSSTLSASGASTYTWSTGSNAASIVVTPAGTTAYTVSGTSGSCSGLSIVTVSVSTVTVLANAGSNQTICISSPSTNLAGNTPAAGSGNWSLLVGSANIVNPSSPTSALLAVGLGTNILQWTVTNGPCFNSSIVYIVVEPLPSASTAGASQTVCATTATLNGNVPSVGTGFWSLVSGAGSITSPGSANSAVTGLGSGTNVFQWSVANNVCFPSTSTVAIVNNAVTGLAINGAQLPFLCQGSSATLTASGASTYSWSTGATTASITVTPSVNSTYTVVGTNGSCSASTVLSQSVSICTGIAQAMSTNYNIVVYPNPFKEELTISAGEMITAQVFNTLGQLVIVKVINGTGTIHTSELAKGVYYINVKGNTGSKTLKIIKE